MGHAPALAEPGLEDGAAPIRTAGITPVAGFDPGHAFGADEKGR
jgi:hypothetical protein